MPFPEKLIRIKLHFEKNFWFLIKDLFYLIWSHFSSLFLSFLLAIHSHYIVIDRQSFSEWVYMMNNHRDDR